MPKNEVIKLSLHECLGTHRHTGACFSNTGIDIDFERQLIRLLEVDADDALYQLQLDPTVRSRQEVVGERSHFFGGHLPMSKFMQPIMRAAKKRPKTADEPLVVVDAYDLPLTVEGDTPALKVREECECKDGETCVICCTRVDLMAFPELMRSERVVFEPVLGKPREVKVIIPWELARLIGIVE